MQLQSHLKITPKDISPYVLLPGDPARVDVIGDCLDNFKIITNNREFRVGKGEYNGKQITVCSTGIGCPSTAIAVEELIGAGAQVLIRVGTCGGAWRSDIPVGSLIIPTASVRDEGTTDEYIPKGFPAVADIDVITALRDAAKTQNAPYYVGINRTHDAFYGAEESMTKWKNAGTSIISSDMESSALFVIATLRGVKAGAVLAVNANPEPLKERIAENQLLVITEVDEVVTQKTVDAAIRVALEAICSLQ